MNDLEICVRCVDFFVETVHADAVISPKMRILCTVLHMKWVTVLALKISPMMQTLDWSLRAWLME